jgi:hypothetical protein
MAIKTLKILCAIIFVSSTVLVGCSTVNKALNIPILPTPTIEKIETIEPDKQIIADGYGEINLLSVMIYKCLAISLKRKQGLRD